MLLSVLRTLFWGTSSWLWTQELPRSSNEQDQSAYSVAAIAMTMMQRKRGKVEGVKYQSELEQDGLGMRLDDIGMRLTLPFVLASRVSNFLVGFSVLLWSAQRLLYRGCLLSVAWTPVCVCVGGMWLYQLHIRFFLEVLFCEVLGKGTPILHFKSTLPIIAVEKKSRV